MPPGRPKGNRAKGDRCTRCILARKGCDGVKPVCDGCHRHPDRCIWPDGRPSRTELLQTQQDKGQDRYTAILEQEDPAEANAALGVISARRPSTNATGLVTA